MYVCTKESHQRSGADCFYINGLGWHVLALPLSSRVGGNGGKSVCRDVKYCHGVYLSRALPPLCRSCSVFPQVDEEALRLARQEDLDRKQYEPNFPLIQSRVLIIILVLQCDVFHRGQKPKHKYEHVSFDGQVEGE